MNPEVAQTLISLVIPALTAILGSLFTFIISKKKHNLQVDKLYTGEISKILDVYKKEQDELLETVNRYIKENEQLRKDIMELKTENTDLIKKNNELIIKVDKLIEENTTLKESLDNIKSDYDKIKSDYNELTSKN